MSSVFGIFENNGNISDSEKDINALMCWNMSYGDAADETFKLNGLFLGQYIDHVNEDLPLCSSIIKKDNKIYVIDALIYNRKEMLDGLSLESDTKISDEELLVQYIEFFGYESLEAVNGDFAGAVYSLEEHSLVLFRDHMGIRPLFYAFNDSFLVFSTDIRGIIANSKVDAKINEDWIYKTIAGYSFQGIDNTEFDNIFCIKPGCYYKFKFSDNKIKSEINVYWSIKNNKIKLRSDKEYQERMYELIEDSVKRRLNVTSGIVGAELSGGLDSGVIDILISRMGRKCIYFSWSISPDELEYAEHDERLIISDICKQEGITCNYGRVEVDKNSVIGKKFQKMKIGVNYDDMSGLWYIMPPYINTLNISQTSEFIHKHGPRVIFTGHGGDEGVSHRSNPYELFYYHEYYHYLRYMYSTTNGQKNRVLKTFKSIKHNLWDVRKEFYKPFNHNSPLLKFINTEFASRFDPNDMPILYFAFDPIKYIKNGGSRNRLDNVALQGAYSGVRYLIPYLDYRVVEYAVSIPRYQYLRGRKNRYVFREAFKDIIPDSLYRFKAKRDFSRVNIKPNPDWFKEFDKNKKTIIDRLDKSFWGKYLNYDLIDKLYNHGEPTGDEKDEEFFIIQNLFQCLLAQNCIEKVKSIDYTKQNF